MTTDGAQQRPIDWHNPIPGETRLAGEEIDRQGQQRDCCRNAVACLRALDLSEWQGTAAEAFGAKVDDQIGQWSRAEQALSSSVEALTDYLDTLLVLQPRAREAADHAQITGTWQSATEDILRWRSQVDRANHRAAVAVQMATEELRSIRPLVGPATAPTVTPAINTPTNNQATASTPPDTDTDTTQRIGHEPVAEQQSPAGLLSLAAALCSALHNATYVSIEQLS